MRNAFRSWMSAASSLAASAVPSGAVAEPAEILQFQGRLLSAAGSPVPNGDYGMTLRFYAAQNDAMGEALVVYIDPAVKVDKGGFSLSVGGKTKLAATSFKDGKANWVGIQVGSDPELPRLQLHQVPDALRASTAANLACTGCVGTDHLAADVLAPYAKTADLTVFAKSDELAKVDTEVATTCFRVMGVDEDSTYKTGVYPVVVGVKNQSACPSGWTYRTTSTTNGNDGYQYMQMSRSASMLGGLYGWAHTDLHRGYIASWFEGEVANKLCLKMFNAQ